MCGIFFRCSRAESGLPSTYVQRTLASRGPDALRSLQFAVSCSLSSQCDFHLTALAAVLSLRGSHVALQPVLSESDGPSSLLCWNGEAWKWDNVSLHCSDTEFIFDRLVSASRSTAAQSHPKASRKGHAVRSVLDALNKISGPFTFVYYDHLHQLIFYGRDVLGRRSLLQRISSDHILELASVCDDTDSCDAWIEVKTDGIYVLDMELVNLHSSTCSASTGGNIVEPWCVPWQSGARVGDTTYLERPFPDFNRDEIDNSPLALRSMTVQKMVDHLEAAVKVRSDATPSNRHQLSDHSGLAILFSGGLDCTLLARLCHDVVGHHRAIDLLNVAFENPRVTQAAADRCNGNRLASSPFEDCPDRICARASHLELAELCPERRWNLVTIDIPFDELAAHRNTIIALLKPQNTEMDFSIGCALYFAARGQGDLQQSYSQVSEMYVTPARVLFSGLGADELFGGYTRHANAFRRTGYSGLIQEMELDFNRIPERNLGRDDRVITNWGKEVRYPFLDEDFVAWTLSLPVSQKCGFGQPTASEPDLEPSKLLLRLGAWHLGLRGAARQKKRAIQFGARTAKMHSGKTKGTQRLSPQYDVGSGSNDDVQILPNPLA